MGNQTAQRPFSQRQLRVGELIKQNLGELLIRNEAKIPSINSKLITVTEVRMTPDLKTAINKIKHEEVEAKILLSDIGMINETDVSLAKASDAVLIGFNVKPNREAKKLAEDQKIQIKHFNIIYEALEFIEKSLSGLLEPDVKETLLGSAEIQKVFKVSNAGKIAGSKVINGEIKSKSRARIIRDGVVVFSGEIQSVFREKNQVKEVGTGLECGISIKNFIDFKEKDVIESYLSEKIQRTI